MIAIRITTNNEVLQFIAKTQEKVDFLISYFAGQNSKVELVPVTNETSWVELCNKFNK